MPEETKSSSGQKNVGMAVLSYLGILVLIPLLTDAKKDPFVKFHIKQGLVLLIADIVASFIIWVPFIGWILWLGIVVLLIIGIINAANGQEKELPVIGSLGSKINI